jgi:hypothetical protein
MKIVISESQYKNLVEYRSSQSLTTEEMEKYMDVYFESLERYEDTIRKFIRVLSYNKFKDVTFQWDPRLNSNENKSFAHRTYFSVGKNWVCFQFTFLFHVLHKIYNGNFNIFMTTSNGMSIAESSKLTPLAFDQNYSKIVNYISEYFKQPIFKK